MTCVTCECAVGEYESFCSDDCRETYYQEAADEQRMDEASEAEDNWDRWAEEDRCDAVQDY